MIGINIWEYMLYDKIGYYMSRLAIIPYNKK